MRKKKSYEIYEMCILDNIFNFIIIFYFLQYINRKIIDVDNILLSTDFLSFYFILYLLLLFSEFQ